MIGRLDIEQVLAGVLFVPPLMTGFLVSGIVVAQLNRKLIKVAVLALSTISALLLIVRSL